MSWTRLDDTFVHDQVWDHVDPAGRWHYLCLVQFCSRTHRYNGIIPLAHAVGCSGLDIATVAEAHQQLALVSLISVDAEMITVLRLDDYLPPPHLRDESRKDASAASTRAWRQRNCEQGKHSKDCPRLTCPVKRQRDQMRKGLRDQSRQDGTGQDRPTTQLQEELAAHVREQPPWLVQDESGCREAVGNGEWCDLPVPVPGDAFCRSHAKKRSSA